MFHREYAAAIDVFIRCRGMRPKDWSSAYNMACAYALLAQTPDAVRHLHLALDLGFDRVSSGTPWTQPPLKTPLSTHLPTPSF